MNVSSKRTLISLISLLSINFLYPTYAKEFKDCQWQSDNDGSRIQANTKTYINFFGEKTFLTAKEYVKNKGGIYDENIPISHYGYIPELYRGVIEYQQCGNSELCGKRFSVNQKKIIIDWMEKQKDPIFTVVYIHGWHHNAQSNDSNFIKFNDLLARVSYQLNVQHPQVKYKLLGIYIGWQGEKSDNKLTTLFTIRSRACAADIVALGIDAKKCNDINNHTLEKNNSDLYQDLISISGLLKNNDQSRMLIIGHSLGGRIVSNLFLQDVQDENSHLGNQTLITTVNPAIGARRYDSIYKNVKDVQSFKKPIWINITSDGDTATKWFYPMSRIFRKERGFLTIGHNDSYITHDLKSDFLGSYICQYNGNFSSSFSTCSLKDAGIKDAYKYNKFTIRPNWIFNSYSSSDSFTVFPELIKNSNGSYEYKVDCSGRNNQGICPKDHQKIYIDVNRIRIIPKVNNQYPLQGKLWNIRTDKEFIDYRGDAATISGKHNAYVDSALISLLVDRTLDLEVK